MPVVILTLNKAKQHAPCKSPPAILIEDCKQPSGLTGEVVHSVISLFCPPLLSPSQTIEFDEGAGAVLRIQPLRTPRDENIYECIAQNSVAEITVTAKLTVLRGKSCKRASLFLSPLSPKHVCLGEENSVGLTSGFSLPKGCGC